MGKRTLSILLVLTGLVAVGGLVMWLVSLGGSGQETSTLATVGSTIEGTAPDIEWHVSFGQVLWSLVVFGLAYVGIKYIGRLLESLAERQANLRLFLKRLVPIFRITGWTATIYVVIVGIFAPPIETLVAFTASAGIALGFASQDILKNVFGGIMILFDRPFQVGDKVQVGSHYGEVTAIGLRSVRLVTPDDSLVSVPNSDIVNQSVSNSNAGEFNCQVVAELYLPAGLDLIELKALARRAAAVSRYVYLEKPIAVIIKNEVHQGRSLLKLRLKAYVLDLRFEFPFMSDMTELLLEALFAKGLVTREQLAGMPESTSARSTESTSARSTAPTEAVAPDVPPAVTHHEAPDETIQA